MASSDGDGAGAAAIAAISPDVVDLSAVRSWMDAVGLGDGPIEGVRLLEGGTQNVLLRFSRGEDDYVLRRPPVHKRDTSDKTMRREARVLAAIADSDVPHPRLLAACDDVDVIGAAFYLMEPVDGFTPTTGMPELHASSPAVRHEMGLHMADAIAALSRVDHRQAVLAGFGRPDGYLERQVERWRSHLDGYARFDGYHGPDLPGVDEVAQWLRDRLPSPSATGIIHGDFHLANVLFSLDGPELCAVVDWELATLGDPLVDLGHLLATWPEADDERPIFDIDPCEGFPSPGELVDRYASGSGRDVSAVGWYEVLACYRLALIIEGTYARSCAGAAPKEVGERLHANARSLLGRALRRMGATG